ncbi:MAG TPA: hypothetical protein VLC10_00285 [Patescibacteria group bacterium]|nr:hypothetical protein [Patescibacteria group bacterium]
MDETATGAAEGPICAVIDYGMPLWRLVDAGGYRHYDADITDERFRPPGEGVCTLAFEVMEFGALPDGDTALALIAARGVRPATFAEALAFGAARPDLPGSGILAAFGSVWGDARFIPPRRYVPVIQAFNGHRYLDLQPLCFPWKAEFKALVTGRQ